jgi:large subunit ribosomal protein L21e
MGTRLTGHVSCAPPPPAGEKAPIFKRLPKGPRDGFSLQNVEMQTITAIPYDIVKEGIQG